MTNAIVADVSSLIYSPSRAVSVGLQEFDRRKNAAWRAEWGVPSLDAYLIPMLPGEVVSLVARPGSAKTTVMLALAKSVRAATETLPEAERPLVIYATWETLIEEFVGLTVSGDAGTTLEEISRGTADLDKVRDAAIRSISSQIYVVGRSLETPINTVFSLVELEQALWTLTEGKRRRIALLCADYLQIIPPPTDSRFFGDMTPLVIANGQRLSAIAKSFGCPVVQGVQSRRDVDEYSGLRFPSLRDAQWSSSVEHVSHKVLSLTRPAMYMDVGSGLKENTTGKNFVVKEELLCLKVVKQRWGKTGGVFFLNIDFSGPSLSDADPDLGGNEAF